MSRRRAYRRRIEQRQQQEVSMRRRALYRDISDTAPIEREKYDTSRKRVLEAVKQGDYHKALALLEDLQTALQKMENDNRPITSRLLAGLGTDSQNGVRAFKDEWVEVFLAQALCYDRLGDDQAAREAWQKAYALEPDEAKLKKTAVQLGLAEP